MSRFRLIIYFLPIILSACVSPGNKGTIAKLRNMHIEVTEVEIEGGLAKAMESYHRFLKETPDSALSPEAIRRLADLKIEKEYGYISSGEPAKEEKSTDIPEATPERVSVEPPTKPDKAASKTDGESETDFEKRSTSTEPLPQAAADSQSLPEGADDLEKAGPREAIALYQKLLREYPLYERNDQVLYQMSRAYEELGRNKEAMKVMDRMVREYPHSNYMDEVQFRRGEYFFTRRKYLDAEDAYKSIVAMGVSSYYYQIALFKLGWTFYKQELYEEALDRFIALLDYKVSEGYDFDGKGDETERKRIDDTFRVISLGFSNLGGADVVVNYFSRNGGRDYEDRIYSNLGEYYFDKRRYSDAAETYNAFVSRNVYHEKAPNYHMRVIEIHYAGGFPSLVIESKKTFATNYGLKAQYWQYFSPGDRPEVLGFLKTNLKDLANHYHALYQAPRHKKKKPINFAEAQRWYREYLATFPEDNESPGINYQLADLLLENRSFSEAAVEYEKTAYNYSNHEKSSKAGYAAVYAHRQHLAIVRKSDQDSVKNEIVRSSLKFVETFPKHEKAAIVLGAAVDDLYSMGVFEQALTNAHKLIKTFPGARKKVVRSAWLVVAHSNFELLRYSDAETAYVKVLDLLPEKDKSRKSLMDNLAVTIYKQGEQANEAEDYRTAANHFLRVGTMAPASKFRPTAEFDAAAALILLKDWKMAATVLSGFRINFPRHELQFEVTKKIAYVYREDGKLSLAAKEYERIEKESKDGEVRREALQVAAELYAEAGEDLSALKVYRRYVRNFPKPVESNLETRTKIAEILKKQNENNKYFKELKAIVSIEASAGKERSPRTRYLAGKAALVLTEGSYDKFIHVKLVKPFKVNLRKKKNLMKKALKKFGKLLDYEDGDATAAAAFYMAEIYAHFSKSLIESERPTGLSPLEMEEYELAIEEQAYPFEDKAISVHQSNLELIALGIYNDWIDKSLQKLAVFSPARYAKMEEKNSIITSLDTYIFAVDRPRSKSSKKKPKMSVEPEQSDESFKKATSSPKADNGNEDERS